MPFTQWIYPAQSEERLRQSRLLQREQGIPALLADILAARGFGADHVAALLADDGSLEDPFLLPDMQIAVDRIEKAIESGEKIAVYGDYDCDGVTSTVILYSYLQSMGADVCYYIPDRLDEGFGMNTMVYTRQSNGQDGASAYYKNSFQGMFYIYTSTSSSTDSEYCVFGELKDEDAESKFQELLDAIDKYTTDKELDSFTEELSDSRIEDSLIAGGSYEPADNFLVPQCKIIIENVTVTKY